MNKALTLFNDALQTTAARLAGIQFPEGITPLVIRDIYGRISIALNCEKTGHEDIAQKLAALIGDLGAYSGKTGNGVLFKEDFFDSESIFQHPDILQLVFPDTNMEIRLLDRQVVGQQWLQPGTVSSGGAKRLVFYGLKGGVGRSTALAIAAFTLARSGNRVLVIDFDLESPGLSSLLLPPERLAEFGLVDWFVEDAVGQGEVVLERMIAASPLAEHTQGEIRVAAAMGFDENFYLDKLSRIYADTPGQAHVERFPARASRLVELLEAQEKPDVVLIDSRAGLHDLAAMSIVGLATHAFLFAVDTPQTWEGYRLLFSHWQKFPHVFKEVREKLVVVHALFPENNQKERVERFVENSYNLFSSTVYEEIEPGTAPNDAIFNFDITNTEAPHFPLRIRWDNRFQEFDPLLLAKGILTEDDIKFTFGHFLESIERLIGDAT